MVIVLYHEVIQGERVQGTMFPAGAWGLESRARCAGFSVTEIGNRKERLRVREAGASAAGRGQRPLGEFPGSTPQNPVPPYRFAPLLPEATFLRMLES